MSQPAATAVQTVGRSKNRCLNNPYQSPEQRGQLAHKGIGKNVHLWLATAWAGAVLWSILSLALYRAPYSHGLDMVGQEVSRFVIPLILAAALSVAFAIFYQSQTTFRRISLL